MDYLDLYSKYEVKECSTLEEFLTKYRRVDRFTGRDGKEWGLDYSKKIINSHHKELLLFGITWISPFESNTGTVVSFKI